MLQIACILDPIQIKAKYHYTKLDVNGDASGPVIEMTETTDENEFLIEGRKKWLDSCLFVLSCLFQVALDIRAKFTSTLIGTCNPMPPLSLSFSNAMRQLDYSTEAMLRYIPILVV